MSYLFLRMGSAFIVGALISQMGSLIHLVTRNILASPSTLAFDGMAVLWILFIHALVVLFQLDVPVFISTIMGIFFFLGVGIYFSRIFKFRLDLNRPLLIGISFNLFVGGLFSLAQFFFQAFNVPFPNELWFGHFRDVNQEAFFSLLGVSIFANFVLLKLHRKITMYSLGPMISQNLNLNSGQFYRWIFVTVGISLFVVISHFGVFSFLGLIFPIFARKFWFKKFDLMGEMHLGSWMNGLFLMGLDYLCYELPIKGAEVPVGLIVSVVGAVSLILLLRKPNSGFETLAKR